MGKAILISIQPKWVEKILNGEKTIEVRKQFPEDYVGWVYIYVTKGKPYLYGDKSVYEGKQEYFWVQKIEGNGIVPLLNGKVVARFWCDKVEEIMLPYTKFGGIIGVCCENERTLQTETLDEPDLLKKSCVSEQEIYKYLNFKKSPRECGYAIHISKLDIFDRPKELSEFRTYKTYNLKDLHNCHLTLTKAPQSWCYIEGE